MTKLYDGFELEERPAEDFHTLTEEELRQQLELAILQHRHAEASFNRHMRAWVVTAALSAPVALLAFAALILWSVNQ